MAAGCPRAAARLRGRARVAVSLVALAPRATEHQEQSSQHTVVWQRVSEPVLVDDVQELRLADQGVVQSGGHPQAAPYVSAQCIKLLRARAPLRTEQALGSLQAPRSGGAVCTTRATLHTVDRGPRKWPATQSVQNGAEFVVTFPYAFAELHNPRPTHMSCHWLSVAMPISHAEACHHMHLGSMTVLCGVRIFTALESLQHVCEPAAEERSLTPSSNRSKSMCKA